VSDPVRLTEQLVAFDTVSAKPNAPLIAFAAERLSAIGAVVAVQARPDDDGQRNLVARIGPERRGGLAFAGHADTVPWDVSMRARTDVERDGSRLYGRGTCDMKGGIAAMLLAAERWARSGRRAGKPLYVVLTFQEEIGCHGAKLLRRTVELPVDACIVGEPTGLAPVTRHKGYTASRLRVHGVPCHSSDPDRGVSAVHAAARAVEALYALGQTWRRRELSSDLSPPWPTLNVGKLAGGTARNVVAESAEMAVEIRPLPGQDGDALVSEARDVAASAVASVQGASAEWIIDEIDPPLHASNDAPLARFLRERSGRDAGTVPFYTEAAFLTAMGPETVVFGPGGIEQAHRVDEFVEIEALLAAEAHYFASIEAFCA
jgi:acetylornithine deacetylase